MCAPEGMPRQYYVATDELIFGSVCRRNTGISFQAMGLFRIHTLNPGTLIFDTRAILYLITLWM